MPDPVSTHPSEPAASLSLPHKPGIFLALVALAGITYFAGLNALPLSDPDEVFYAQTAREMLEHHSVLTPLMFGQPQFEKPPLTYWCLMASFEAFGVTPWAARLIPALFGLLGVLATYWFGRRVLSESTAAVAALIQASTMVYLGQSIALLTDMVFTSLIVVSMWGFYLWFTERRDSFLYLFAVAAALAMLVKGPVGIVVQLLAIVAFLIVAKSRDALRSFLLHPWWLAFLIVAAPWYLYATLTYGRAFTWEFLVHDNWHRILAAEHSNFDNQYFYPAVIIVGMFPWTPLLAFLGTGWRKHRELATFLAMWFLAVYVIFAIAHSKLASYILPLFPAIAIAMAISLQSFARTRRRVVAAAVLFVLFGAGLVAAPFLAKGPLAAELRPVLLVIAAFGVVQIACGALLALRRLGPVIVLNAAGFLGVILAGALSLPASAVAGFTDADISAIAAANGLSGQTVVASKLYARGVHFHSGNPIAVMDTRPNPFWSPHPIEVLWQDEQIRAFFDGRDKVLCVIRPGDVQRLNRLFAGARTQKPLSDKFDRVVVLSVKN
ncbi:MAG: glycosyltransferase family 39 protein [Acidobacteriia bacterium]|nr:glycosyltransferase family 39 protein [Terriglobia bacterium]